MTVAGSSSGTRPRVVVVGGGFAGLSAVRELREADVEVLLLDRDLYTTFQPLLYQVATGALNAGDITYGLRSFVGRYRNVRFRRACVVGLDPVARRVRLDDGLEVGYDYLILGCGVTANFFGIPGAAEHARTTYTRAAAIGVRDQVLGNLEAYAQGRDGAVEPVVVVVGGGPTGVEMAGALAELRNAGLAYAYPEVDQERVRVVLVEMTDEVLGNLEAYAQGREGAVEPVVVVVGGGPTGVEMAGALAELRNAGLAYAYPEVDQERVRVVLVEMTDEVLAPFDPKLREYAAGALRERGVDLRLGVGVKEVRSDSVLLADGERLPSSSTIWATGVKVDDAVSAWGLPQGRGGRIQVGPDLRVEGHPEIFAVGDVAADRDAPLPQLARPAIDGGRHAGTQVRRLLAGESTEPFVYRDRGISATIGRSDAVIQLPFGVKLRGLVAWLGWVGVHVVLLMGGRNRLATMVNLAVRYLTWRRAPNLIVGDPP